MQKRAIIVCNGDLSDNSALKQIVNPNDVIICADNGLEKVLNEHFIPTVIIGDMDSISEETKKKAEKYPLLWLSYPEKKNETDTELALSYAVDEGYEEIVIVGILGTRIDHVLANIFMLSLYPTKNITIIEGHQELFIIRKEKIINGEINDLLSLIPLSTDCTGITTEGLEYKLDNGTLFFGKPRGISNVFLEKTVRVSVKQGLLLAIHTKAP